MFGLPLPRLGRPSRFSNASFTGVIKGPDGTAGAPSYTFTTDPTTGMYSGGAGGDVRWAVSGTVSAVLNSSGGGTFSVVNLGVGLIGDVVASRSGSNAVRWGATSATTTSRTEINKTVTAFTNAVAKTVFTVTVPNAAHHAVIELEVQGALGAGGAIGAGEAMATNTYKIAIVRTAGVATVATATAAGSAVAVAVAGANTVTATAAVSAMSGAVGATQTFTIDVTITKNAGTSDNHTCLAYAKLMNANATGITIA